MLLLSFHAILPGSVLLSLDARRGHTLHEPFLEQEEDDQYRDGNHRREGENVSPYLRVLTEKLLDGNGQRSVLESPGYHQRPQELSPVGKELQNSYGGEDGP